MKHRLRNVSIAAILVAGFGTLAGTGTPPAFAQSASVAPSPDESDIDRSLEAKPKHQSQIRTRGFSDPKTAAEQQLIGQLRKRSITPIAKITEEERGQIAKMIEEKPNIDLEIYFDYDSAVVGPKAVPALVKLGNVLSKEKHVGTIFLINGYTDAKGSPEYNLVLSQRRAEAVKQYLLEQYKLPPETLIATGFGKEQLKLPGDPNAEQNRRVQIVNSEHKASAEAK
jgi:outer membrane protein OmpA-like peptidoglycan-associated protein